jgi:hypothetical protein
VRDAREAMLLNMCLGSCNNGEVLYWTEVNRASASGNVISVSTKTTGMNIINCIAR